MRDNKTIELSSSLRVRTAEESLALAESIARSRGVVRVVDITQLDRIGIPVFTSIRPDAPSQFNCVCAGKGLKPNEARIGAFMEAIEFSFAVPGQNRLALEQRTPRDIVRSFGDGFQFLEFAPRKGSRVEPDELLSVVRASEIKRGLGEVLVPAELVLHPFGSDMGKSLYGTTTNGLASGNNLEEAIVHGLCEVMERHISAFQLLRNTSEHVPISSLSPKLRSLVARVEDAGLQCVVRFAGNEFGLPFFSAYVLEPDDGAPIALAAGFGFHPNKEIAAVRAITEAAQSRLSYIHGGRDDLIHRYRWAAKVGRQTELDEVRYAKASVVATEREVSFNAIPSAEVHSLEHAKTTLFQALSRARFEHVVVIPLTDEGYPFQVVRVIVPGCESFSRTCSRVGPRLLEFIRHA